MCTVIAQLLISYYSKKNNFKSKYCFFKNSFIIVMDLIIHSNITLLKLMRLVKLE